MTNPYEKRDRKFAEAQSADPALTFARYENERRHRRLLSGRIGMPDGAIAAALGADFWGAGEAKAKKLLAKMAPAPSQKVVEYGCGALRIGAHFIRRLAPGCFFGLDVISGFYEFGATAIGREIMDEKAPRLHVIDEQGLGLAEAFAADIVFSNVVCVHVHPSETAEYFRNLARIAHKPGARLFFNAWTSEQPVRFEYSSWSWPLETYRQRLGELELVNVAAGNPQTQGGAAITPVELEFRRA